MPSSGCPWQGFPKCRVDAALAFACTYCRPMVGWWLLLVIHCFKYIPMWALIVSHPQPPTDSPPARGWGKQKWADGRSYEGQWQARACEGGTGQAGKVATEGYCNSWSFLLPKIFLTSIEILKLFLTQSFAYDVSFFVSFFCFQVWDPLRSSCRPMWCMARVAFDGRMVVRTMETTEMVWGRDEQSQMGSGWDWGCVKIILLHDCWWICFQVRAQWWDNLLQRVKPSNPIAFTVWFPWYWRWP